MTHFNLVPIIVHFYFMSLWFTVAVLIYSVVVTAGFLSPLVVHLPLFHRIRALHILYAVLHLIHHNVDKKHLF
jgi:hypothetical protein